MLDENGREEGLLHETLGMYGERWVFVLDSPSQKFLWYSQCLSCHLSPASLPFDYFIISWKLHFSSLIFIFMIPADPKIEQPANIYISRISLSYSCIFIANFYSECT